MSEITESMKQEIAEWVGFTQEETPNTYDIGYQLVRGWRNPDGSWCGSRLPNLTDPTNLFCWVVPHLEAQKFRMMITWNNIKRPKQEHMYRVSFCKFKTNSWGKVYHKDLGYALFLAIYAVCQQVKAQENVKRYSANIP